MSKIILEGNVAGTAAFTLKAPATSNNRTITLPDVTGTLATGEHTSVPIGSVIYHTGTTAPAGYVIANGQYLNRTTYADLWAYAQTSGNLVVDAAWTASKYSSGDLSTTFRVPNIASDSVITCIRAYNTISDTATLNAGALVSEVNEKYDKSSIVGIVSQTNSIPTGAIIESGSNANGNYIKWADGTMICTITSVTMGVGAITAVGSLFQTATPYSWTFPVAFIATPYAGSAIAQADGTRWFNFRPTSNTTGNIHQFSATTDATLRSFSAFAIGRWF